MAETDNDFLTANNVREQIINTDQTRDNILEELTKRLKNTMQDTEQYKMIFTSDGRRKLYFKFQIYPLYDKHVREFGDKNTIMIVSETLIKKLLKKGWDVKVRPPAGYDRIYLECFEI